VRLIYDERSVKTVRVQLKPSYDVLIGKGLLATAGRRIERLLAPTHTFVVSSRRILKLHNQALTMPKGKLTFETISEGEENKSMDMAFGLLADFARLGADRGSCVVAFGGGVIGDLGAFAASIYMRGIPVVQIPTTLLAQVDAAIGGKTAVNVAQAKNLIGTFHQPRLVIADTNVLSTLPDREFRAGIFEVIKSGIIRDPALFRYTEKNAASILKKDARALTRIIASAVKVKASVVAADEKESDLRRILNFGHTIGHALEAATGYRQLLHGEAVGLGMIAAAEIGVNIGVTPESVAERIIGCVLQYGPLPKVKVDAAKVFRAIRSDKKTVNARPHFVLIEALGATVVRNDVPDAVIKSAIRSVIA
jgi:3-dehydroquinate synthase